MVQTNWSILSRSLDHGQMIKTTTFLIDSVERISCNCSSSSHLGQSVAEEEIMIYCDNPAIVYSRQKKNSTCRAIHCHWSFWLQDIALISLLKLFRVQVIQLLMLSPSNRSIDFRGLHQKHEQNQQLSLHGWQSFKPQSQATTNSSSLTINNTSICHRIKPVQGILQEVFH